VTRRRAPNRRVHTDEVEIRLTSEQIAEVIRQSSNGGSVAALLGGLDVPLPSKEALEERLADPSTCRSLVLGLLLLFAFPSNGEPRGLGEVADNLRMPHSTAHRYVKTLAGMGLLEREPGRRGYRRALGSAA